MTSSQSRIPSGISNTYNQAEAPTPVPVDSDFIVILAALLCALICVIGLIAVARCAWLRRLNFGRGTILHHSTSSSTTTTTQSSSPANKGLKKKILRSLPKLNFSDELKEKLVDCAICLTEFVVDDEIRVLPQCGHGFHVGCIDTWLGSHSSCPSCRQILVVTRCQKCGGFPATTTTTTTCATSSTSSGSIQVTEAELKAREDDLNRFLP